MVRPDFDLLSETDRKILGLLAQDRTAKQIATEVNRAEKTVKNRITEVRHKLGLQNRGLVTLMALYGNWLGLRGELISGSPVLDTEFGSQGIVVSEGRVFSSGIAGGTPLLRYPAHVVSNELRKATDATCILEEFTYEPPQELTRQLPKPLSELREHVDRQASNRGEICYEESDVLVVTRLRADTETFAPVQLTLRRARYLTPKAIKGTLTPAQKNRYLIHDPWRVNNQPLPLLLAVCLHIVAGDPPQLIVARREGNLGAYGGFYSAAVEGLGQANQDVTRVQGQSRFDIAGAMWRELMEERYAFIPEKTFRDKLQMLGLIFDYRALTYILLGFVAVPEANPGRICGALSSAKEARHYETVPYPGPFPVGERRAASSGAEEITRALCQHIIRGPWTPCGAIGLIILLKRQFGEDVVEDCLEVPAGRV